MAGELGQSPYQEMDVIEIGPASTQSVEQQMQAKLAAAKLNCQICGKFSTFSFRTFQSHIRRHQQANEIGPESIHRKLVRSGRVRRKYSVSSRAKRFRLHLTNMSLNAQLNNVQTTSTRSMALVCPHCKFTADKFSNLSIHVKRKHTNLVQTQLFLCTKCHFSAPSRRALQSHLLQMNHYERQCQICNEVFEGNSQYLDHLSLHFSGISVSPVKEQSEQSSGFNSAAHVSSLHDALKEAALLETEVASNSHFSSRGKSRSLPLVEDVQRPVFSKSVIAKLCDTNGGATSSKSFSDGKPSDDREVTMETQACASAAVEMEMCIDSVACNAETQTENEKPTEKESRCADDNDGGMNIDVTNSDNSPSTSGGQSEETIESSSIKKTSSASNETETSNVSKLEVGSEKKQPEAGSDDQISSSEGTTKESVQEYTCVHCDITFRDKVLFTVHRGSHGFKNPFSCNLCGADLKDKYEFAAHFHCS